ncbi:MAG: AraC family transcriptional regulator, partial [Chloroflexi bacterium]
MSILSEERSSDSPYVEKIIKGRTVSDGSSVRPAESHWHMVFTRFERHMLPIYVGPLTSAGVASWGEGAEIIWIKFKLGVFLRQLPPNDFLDTETILPDAGSQSFWLNGSAWQFPNFENVETFIARLVRDDVLVEDPVVHTVLHGHYPEMSPRTVRHRFLRSTGMTRSRIYQIERAQQAAELLEQGVPIMDTVFELGYYDQPHL